MGLPRPETPDPAGDASVISPREHEPSLLVSVRGTNRTKRLESDSTGSLFTSSAEESVIVDKVSTTNITYVCKAPIGSNISSAVWKCFILDKTSGYTQVKWADGNSNYDNVALNKTSLTYI